MLDKSALLFVIPMIQKDELFRVEAETFSKSEPGLVFEPFVILLDKIIFVKRNWSFVIYGLLIGFLFAARIDQLKYRHLVDSHVFNLTQNLTYNYSHLHYFIIGFHIKSL